MREYVCIYTIKILSFWRENAKKYMYVYLYIHSCAYITQELHVCVCVCVYWEDCHFYYWSKRKKTICSTCDRY
jgi:hypothetical protein